MSITEEENEVAHVIFNEYHRNLERYFKGEKIHNSGVHLPTPFWKDLANRYQQIRGERTILELGDAIVEGEIDRSTSQDIAQTEVYRNLFFAFANEEVNWENRPGQYLMADILSHRLTKSSTTVRSAPEAHAMLVEYGYGGGLFTPSNSVNGPLLYEVVRKVLWGHLKLTHNYVGSDYSFDEATKPRVFLV